MSRGDALRARIIRGMADGASTAGGGSALAGSRVCAGVALAVALASCLYDWDGPLARATPQRPGNLGEACSPTAPCGALLYCGYADFLCGNGTDAGMCQAIPTTSCNAEPVPAPGAVCGCDGLRDTSECAVRSRGMDVAQVGAGGCAARADEFACGYRICLNPVPPLGAPAMAPACAVHGRGTGSTWTCTIPPLSGMGCFPNCGCATDDAGVVIETCSD
jgi:hypothetical protein